MGLNYLGGYQRPPGFIQLSWPELSVCAIPARSTLAASVGRRSGRAIWETGVSRRGERSTSAVGGRGRRGIVSTRRPPRGLCGKGGGAVAGHVDVLGGHRPQRPGAAEGPIPENREHWAVGCPGRLRRSGFHRPTLARRGAGLGESSSEFEAITDHHPTQVHQRPRGLGLDSRPRPPGAGGVVRPRASSTAGASGVDMSVWVGCPARTGTEFEIQTDRRGPV
jgi:hypothetical protein